MITFVYKTGFEDKKKGDNFKPLRRISKSKKMSSQPTDEDKKLSPQSSDGARRDGSIDVTYSGLIAEKARRYGLFGHLGISGGGQI